jgi:hypothetical protein
MHILVAHATDMAIIRSPYEELYACCNQTTKWISSDVKQHYEHNINKIVNIGYYQLLCREVRYENNHTKGLAREEKQAQAS